MANKSSCGTCTKSPSPPLLASTRPKSFFGCDTCLPLVVGVTKEQLVEKCYNHQFPDKESARIPTSIFPVKKGCWQTEHPLAPLPHPKPPPCLYYSYPHPPRCVNWPIDPTCPHPLPYVKPVTITVKLGSGCVNNPACKIYPKKLWLAHS
jgi:hypothetical protein